MHVFWDLWIQWSNCPFFVAKKDLHWKCLAEKGKSGYFCQDARICSTPNIVWDIWAKFLNFLISLKREDLQFHINPLLWLVRVELNKESWVSVWEARCYPTAPPLLCRFGARAARWKGLALHLLSPPLIGSHRPTLSLQQPIRLECEWPVEGTLWCRC